ncbi:hypothetical protein D3C83_55570 [compost metagenome]
MHHGSNGFVISHRGQIEWIADRSHPDQSSRLQDPPQPGRGVAAELGQRQRRTGICGGHRLEPGVGDHADSVPVVRVVEAHRDL